MEAAHCFFKTYDCWSKSVIQKKKWFQLNLPDLFKNSDNLKLRKKTSLKERHVEDAETTFDLVKSKAEYTATWLSDQQLN